MNNAKKRKDRKRSMLWALFLHAALVGVCVYPFLTSEAEKPQTYQTVVELDFSQSAAAASQDTRVRNQVKRKVTERKAAPKNPAPPALPTKTSVPVLTEPSPIPLIKEIPVPPMPDPEPEITPNPNPAPEVVDIPMPESGPPASTNDSDGNSNASGDETGSPEIGDGDTVSDVGEGESPIGSALNGNGIITRAVIYRPELDDVIKENGSVVLNICINQKGRVIGVKWNEERSTIKETSVVREAMDKVKYYKFETKYDAPKRECGALSIHIKGL